jgi:16S rRNA (cytosine1402-N4)-methyltransferase
MRESIHIAVLTEESTDALNPRSGGVYLDATLGGGTHSRTLLEKSAPNGRVISLDVDPSALERAKEHFQTYGTRWQGVESNFRDLAEVVEREGLGPMDGILIDLGFSSDELADPSKGLSFQTEGPLDMRFGDKSNEDGLTAAEIVNSWKEFEIAKILKEFGDERYARPIASAIFRARKVEPIITTFQLADIIRAAVPKSYEQGRIDPATRTFQALRIVVNDELEVLKDAIKGAEHVLAEGGRLAIIAFHSLEDAIVKQAFKTSTVLTPVTKKPIVPSEDEVSKNPRARSAKLRIATKINPELQKSKQKYVPRIRDFYDTAT